MKLTKSVFGFILLFLLSGIPAELVAQIPVEASKEKVIISGVQYYIHNVKKGQTAYSIAKAYGISVQDLTTENPQALYGLKEGQSLRIPAKQPSKTPEPAPQKARVKDEVNFIYHALKPGETVYSLSKSYGVSENEIIQSNPGIDINKLPVGSEIAVPRRDFMNQKQKFVDQEQRYVYHKVERGETLSSIADKYGVTLRVLRRENRNLRFPRVGDFVRIPSAELAEKEKEPVVADTVPEVIEEEVIKFEKPSGYTIIKNLEGSMDIAVLLPFYLKENARRTDIDSSKVLKGRKQYKASGKDADWIYPESLDFVEMYNGILAAADTLRSMGLNINLFTYDIKSDSAGIIRLITAGKLDGMDLIIGPVYSYNLSIVSRYAKGLGIPVVSPVELMNNSVLTDNPTLFMADCSLEVIQEALAKKISEDSKSNLVFIHTDSTKTDTDVQRFKNLIFTELSYKIPFEEIKFKELVFYSRSTFGNDSINRLSHSLSENSENTVIIASEDPPVVSEIITIIHGLSKKFNVKVYGYPSMAGIDNRLDPKEFFDLNLLILSPKWIDHSGSNVLQFDLNYKKKFLTMPLESSLAWIGYDIAYYFISGLAMHGSEFIKHPEIHNPALLQNDFDFGRKSMNDGFENQKIFRIRYTRDYELRLE